MATIETKIETALLAHVASLALTPALAISWPNEIFEPPQTDTVPPKLLPYLRVTHVPNTNRRLFLGASDPHQRLGLLQIDVMHPLNKGAGTATEIAGQIAEHFACSTALWSDGIKVSITKAPDVNQAIRDDTRWMVPISIFYECYA